MSITLEAIYPIYSVERTSQECSICLLKLDEPSIIQQLRQNNSEEVRIAYSYHCSHVFHYDCIAHQSQFENTCPLCGREWETRNIIYNKDGQALFKSS